MVRGPTEIVYRAEGERRRWVSCDAWAGALDVRDERVAWLERRPQDHPLQRTRLVHGSLDVLEVDDFAPVVWTRAAHAGRVHVRCLHPDGTVRELLHDPRGGDAGNAERVVPTPVRSRVTEAEHSVHVPTSSTSGTQ